ncbi:NUDIX hydrolase [Alteracholeplasma palmae J233]|uniref:NUDIX hydrolase n=1 Tax=Alteracholeplasma palmae (strain ATCC 49389 / J233) TaxID=1318466 RepID=U4KL03_ALTPJ|nr:NUDIX domain-containing protein [Alteracholeplasma palmae]CCV64393.1 NUDIX hydrolase [Alteracholeplasma palmae J233]
MFNYTIGIEYKSNGSTEFDRKAARAIIIKNNKILVLASDNDEVKLPGGGLDENETFIDALNREVLEETGYTVLKNKEFGIIDTYGKSKTDQTKVFSMQSKYYLVEISDIKNETNFQGYEITQNFNPIWISIEEAIKTNETAYSKNIYNDIAERELLVFKEIMKYMSR